MDPITRRSAVLATVIHACLVALAFLPRGCSETAMPTTPPPPDAPAPTAAVPADDRVPDQRYGLVVAVPATAAASPALPALDGGLPPLPDPGTLIAAVRQDHAGRETSRGDQDGAAAPVALPALPPRQEDLIAGRPRTAVSNETLTREQRMLATAQEFLHGRLQMQIDRHWRHLLPQVTQPRLIIELRVDRRGRPVSTQVITSTGSLTLDRLIDEWLRHPDLVLPPITPDIVYPFLIVIRR
jgi:outer membrane biosynthesis protein TonB